MLFFMPIMLFPNPPAMHLLCSQPTLLRLSCSILVVKLPFSAVIRAASISLILRFSTKATFTTSGQSQSVAMQVMPNTLPIMLA